MNNLIKAASPLLGPTIRQVTQQRTNSSRESNITRRALYDLYYSLQDRMDMENKELKDPEQYRKINVGLPMNTISREERIGNCLSQKNSTLEQAALFKELSIDLEESEKDWTSTTRPKFVRTLADHFQIFKHLFGPHAFFHPVVTMDISYDCGQDFTSPVYFGNLLKPNETCKAPSIKFDSKPDELWTLLAINPDGNLHCSEAECLHWFVGNIPGGDVEKGDQIIDYLQPFPAKGTGFHRFVYLLYKQTEHIDYSKYKKQAPCLTLKERTFYNQCFYKDFEKNLTPAGLSWFQVDYDYSLTEFFHKTLQMREPVFEYDFPKPYIKKAKRYPGRMHSFHNYLDLHRDPKKVDEDIFLKRLRRLNPLRGDMDVLEFPLAHRDQFNLRTPFWLVTDFDAENEGSAKYRSMYKLDNRPRPTLRKLDRIPEPRWKA